MPGLAWASTQTDPYRKHAIFGRGNGRWHLALCGASGHFFRPPPMAAVCRACLEMVRLRGAA